MKVIVGCECSGVVRDEFIRRGHDAWSCDLKPSEQPGPHIQGDVFEAIARGGWDLLIVHPDCTYLTGSAEWAYKDPDYVRYPGVGYHQKVKPETLTGAARREARERALEDVRRLLACGVGRIALENPIGVIGTRFRKADQIVQPHQFGDDASKATGLWLVGLPLLRPTQQIEPRMVDGKPRWANQTDNGQNRLSPSPSRATDRARTYPGLAAAMAEQWGGI